jgi:hypothetical protein
VIGRGTGWEVGEGVPVVVVAVAAAGEEVGEEVFVGPASLLDNMFRAGLSGCLEEWE